jgi:hypothetical protein
VHVGEDNHPPHAGFGRNAGPAFRLDANRRELAGRFFRSLLYLTCPCNVLYIYILSLLNLIVTVYILYYNFNTTKLVYMSKMAHERQGEPLNHAVNIFRKIMWSRHICTTNMTPVIYYRIANFSACSPTHRQVLDHLSTHGQA